MGRARDTLLSRSRFTRAAGVPEGRDLDAVLAALVGQFASAIEAPVTLLAAWDRAARRLAVRAAHGATPDRSRSFAARSGLLGEAFCSEAPEVRRLDADAAKLGLAPGDLPRAELLLTVPLRRGAARVGALIAAFPDAGSAPPEEELLEAAHAFGVLASHITGTVHSDALAAGGIDPLTGCLEPATLREVLSEECERCERHGRPLSLAVLLLEPEPRSGRLSAIARDLLIGVRAYDSVGRNEGAFVVVMPETTLETAEEVVGRLRHSVGLEERMLCGVAGWVPGARPQRLLDTAGGLARDWAGRHGGIALALARPDHPAAGIFGARAP